MESLQQCTLEQRFQKSTKRLETFNDYFSDIPPGKDREYVEAFIPNIESMANLLFGEETSIGQVCTYPMQMLWKTKLLMICPDIAVLTPQTRRNGGENSYM